MILLNKMKLGLLIIVIKGELEYLRKDRATRPRRNKPLEIRSYPGKSQHKFLSQVLENIWQFLLKGRIKNLIPQIFQWNLWNNIWRLQMLCKILGFIVTLKENTLPRTTVIGSKFLITINYSKKKEDLKNCRMNC